MAMPPIGVMGGFQNMLADPRVMQGMQQQPQMQPQPQPQMQQESPAFQPRKLPGGFLNVLGRIGDIMAVMGGRNAVYQPWRDQRETQNAFGQWAANPDDKGAFANFLSVDPGTAWKAYQQRQEGDMERQKLALQGRKLELDANNPDLVVIDGVAFDKRTGTPKFESPYTRIIPGAEGSFYEQPRIGYGRQPGTREAPSSAAERPVRVQSPDEARRLPPGTLFTTPDGRTKRVPGGAGSGPQTFR